MRDSLLYILCNRASQVDSVEQHEVGDCGYAFVVRTADADVCALLSQRSTSPSLDHSLTLVPTYEAAADSGGNANASFCASASAGSCGSCNRE